MIKSARLELYETGYRLYDFHYAGEIYPVVEVSERGFMVHADYGMDIRQIQKDFCVLVHPAIFYIYMPEKGFYSDNLRKLKRDVWESEYRDKLSGQKKDWLTQEELEELLVTLQNADRKSRGYDIDNDGTVLIPLRGKSCPISPLDESRFLYLVFFGGFLGLHRFYARNFISAMFYLFSCGGFVIGWFLDIMLFYSLRFKDGAGKYILPDEGCYQKLFLLVFVSFIACIALTGYLVLIVHLHRLII